LAELVDIASLRGRTRLLVMQGTPFCNLACDYCYLPNRNDRSRMPHEIVGQAVDWVYRNGLAADPLTVVWHAGEPLALPKAWYEEAFVRVREAAPSGASIVHAVQTNGVTVDAAWCDLFRRYRVEVGVSIDGPARLHDLHRRTRDGRGTHAAAMRGVAVLRQNSIPFHAISVITNDSLDSADEFVDFFLTAGIEQIGLNVEEIEGIHATSTIDRMDARLRFAAFLDRVLERAEASGRLSIREADLLLAQMLDASFGSVSGNDQNTPFSIVTISHDGSIATFSPELAGTEHPRHGLMILGHVARSSVADILRSATFVAFWKEISEGIGACATGCPYFRLCGGGAPANKLAELGTMAGTETMHCRLTQQVVTDVLLRRLEHKLQGAPREHA
jgi:uncharacterized protein